MLWCRRSAPHAGYEALLSLLVMNYIPNLHCEHDGIHRLGPQAKRQKGSRRQQRARTGICVPCCYPFLSVLLRGAGTHAGTFARERGRGRGAPGGMHGMHCFRSTTSRIFLRLAGERALLTYRYQPQATCRRALVDASRAPDRTDRERHQYGDRLVLNRLLLDDISTAPRLHSMKGSFVPMQASLVHLSWVTTKG